MSSKELRGDSELGRINPLNVSLWYFVERRFIIVYLTVSSLRMKETGGLAEIPVTFSLWPFVFCRPNTTHYNTSSPHTLHNPFLYSIYSFRCFPVNRNNLNCREAPGAGEGLPFPGSWMHVLGL